MKRITLLVALALAVGAVLWSGCGCEQEPTRTVPIVTTQEPAVKSMEEYRREAAEEISAEDAEQELERLQKEIESDLE